MKRIIIAVLIALLLTRSPAAMAENAARFPAYDEATGKWGYIDVNGQWAIAPQYDGASGFRGGYARDAVSRKPYSQRRAIPGRRL